MDSRAPRSGSETFSPVIVAMREVVGTSFLGLLALVLLIAYLRAQARIRDLTERLATHP